MVSQRLWFLRVILNRFLVHFTNSWTFFNQAVRRIPGNFWFSSASVRLDLSCGFSGISSSLYWVCSSMPTQLNAFYHITTWHTHTNVTHSWWLCSLHDHTHAGHLERDFSFCFGCVYGTVCCEVHDIVCCAELQAACCLHCDPASIAQHSQRLLETGIWLRLHFHRHAERDWPDSGEIYMTQLICVHISLWFPSAWRHAKKSLMRLYIEQSAQWRQCVEKSGESCVNV